MKRFFACVLVCAAVALPVLANDFDSVCASLAAHPIVKGRFEQTRFIASMDRRLVSSGTYLIAAGRGMIWNTLKPYPSTMAVGTNSRVQWRPGGKKTAVPVAGNQTFLRIAAIMDGVFSGKAGTLKENFTVSFKGLPGGAWEIGLVPRDETVASFAKRIRIAGTGSGAAASVIETVELDEASGDSVVYKLSSPEYPARLTSEEASAFQ
jgi:hypothetical protein